MRAHERVPQPRSQALSLLCLTKIYLSLGKNLGKRRSEVKEKEPGRLPLRSLCTTVYRYHQKYKRYKWFRIAGRVYMEMM